MIAVMVTKSKTTAKNKNEVLPTKEGKLGEVKQNDTSQKADQIASEIMKDLLNDALHDTELVLQKKKKTSSPSPANINQIQQQIDKRPLSPVASTLPSKQVNHESVVQFS